MLGQFDGVVTRPVDEGRFAATEKLKPEYVEAGRRSDAASMAYLSMFVEDRHLQPRIATAKACRPQHRGDACRAQIDC
jgi:hypothetical protein